MNVKMVRTFLILALSLAGTANAATPVRMRITVQPGTLRPGQIAAVNVQFLGRDYQAVPNDVKRVVQLTWKAVDSGAAGNVASIPVAPGASSAAAQFQCPGLGRIVVIAASTGLDSTQTLVVGVRSRASRIENWLVPSVLAASDPKVQIYPSYSEQPANGVAKVMMKVSLLEPVGRGETVVVRFTTSRQLRFSYQDKDSYDILRISIPEGRAESDDIVFTATQAQNIEVTARVTPGGSTDKATLRFVAPKPVKVYVDPASTILGRLIGTAEVGLEDQDHVKVAMLDKEHRIELYSDDPRHLLSIDPPMVLLTPRKPIHQVNLRMADYPPGGKIDLLGKDKDVDLDSFVAHLTVENPVRKVRISGQRQLHSNDLECAMVVSLLNEQGKSVSAEWDTQVSLHSEQLVPHEKIVTIPKGKSRATATYALPRSTRRAVVTGSLGDIPDSENSFGLAVVAAMYALILLACLGGTLGALTRQFFFEEVRFLKPRWVDGCLRPGLMGNTSFGALFGTIAFIAFEVGLFRQFGIWASVSDSWGEPSVQAGPAAMAFLLGFVGGYGGPVLLDRLLRIQRKPEPEPATPATVTT